jgi:hypothetical protein
MHEARPRTTARRLLAGGSVVCYIVLITAGVHPQHIAAERCGPVAAGELRAAVGPTHSGLPGACGGRAGGRGARPARAVARGGAARAAIRPSVAGRDGGQARRQRAPRAAGRS